MMLWNNNWLWVSYVITDIKSDKKEKEEKEKILNELISTDIKFRKLRMNKVDMLIIFDLRKVQARQGRTWWSKIVAELPAPQWKET